jgi:hypothetical protein
MLSASWQMASGARAALDLTWRPVHHGGGKLAYHEKFLQNIF